MLEGATNAELYCEFFRHIEDSEVQEALALLVGLAAALQNVEFHPQRKGVVRDFRFLAGAEMPFAFIPNKRWLLFYFRLSAVRSGKYDLDELKKNFDGVDVNATGEWTVRLRSISDVRRLWHFLKLDGDRAPT